MSSDEPLIQITVSDSIYWVGGGACVVSGTLPQYIEILESAATPLFPLATGIADWLRHDTWTQEEGLLLLLGLDPEGTVISQSNWVNANNERLNEIAKAHFLDGREIDFVVWRAVFDHLKSHGYSGIDDGLAKKVKREIWQLSESYRDMKAVWESGNHAARNTPKLFVEWASSKGYKVEWSGLARNLLCCQMLGDPNADDAATAAQAEDKQDGSKSDEPKFITRNQVIGKFPVKADPDENFKFWDGRLARPPKWLVPALASVGKAGTSSMWKPLIVAHCLLEGVHKKPFMELRQLDALIHKVFPEWLDTWKEETQDMR